VSSPLHITRDQPPERNPNSVRRWGHAAAVRLRGCAFPQLGDSGQVRPGPSGRCRSRTGGAGRRAPPACSRACVLPCSRAPVLPCLRAPVLPCSRGRPTLAPAAWNSTVDGRRTARAGLESPTRAAGGVSARGRSGTTRATTSRAQPVHHTHHGGGAAGWPDHPSVDNRGVEPRGHRLQGGAAHRCVAREPAVGLEPTAFPLREGCTTRRAALALRTLGRIRTGTVRSLRPSPLPLGYEGRCPRMRAGEQARGCGPAAGSGGLEPPRAGSGPAMLPLHQLPSRPAGGSGPPAGRGRVGRRGRRQRPAAPEPHPVTRHPCGHHRAASVGRRMFMDCRASTGVVPLPVSCLGRDSNAHCSGFGPDASAGWATEAWRSGSGDSNPVCACVEGRYPTGWATTAY
jgi:hypothetical protein